MIFDSSCFIRIPINGFILFVLLFHIPFKVTWHFFGRVSPCIHKVHNHMVNIFTKCIINVVVEVLFANNIENFLMMSPISQLISCLTLLAIQWFDINKVQTIFNNIYYHLDDWKPIIAWSLCWILSKEQQIFQRFILNWVSFLGIFWF